MRVTTLRDFRDRATSLLRSKDPVLITRDGMPAGFFIPWDQPDLPDDAKRGDYLRHESEARERMRSRDVEDWPSVALAFALAESRDVAIWTNDKDFGISGIETITTAQLLARLDRRARL